MIKDSIFFHTKNNNRLTNATRLGNIHFFKVLVLDGEAKVANIKSAIKRAIQNEKHRQRNASYRSAFRTSVKSVLKAILSGNKDVANSAFLKAQSMIDKTAQKGLIHKNKAARIKHRMIARLKAMVAK